MLIYLAGPLFSEANRRFNAQLTEKLEALGFRVFLPQRDGLEREKPPYDAITPKERRHATFDLDLAKILEADVFLFISTAAYPTRARAWSSASPTARRSSREKTNC